MNLGTYRNVVNVGRRHLATGTISSSSLGCKDMVFYITRCKKSAPCTFLVLPPIVTAAFNTVVMHRHEGSPHREGQQLAKQVSQEAKRKAGAILTPEEVWPACSRNIKEATTSYGKFLKRWEYQTTFPVS